MAAMNNGLGIRKRHFRIGDMAAHSSQRRRPQSLSVVPNNSLRRHPLSCRLQVYPASCARSRETTGKVAIAPLTVNDLNLTWSRQRTQDASFSVASVCQWSSTLGNHLSVARYSSNGGHLCGRLGVIPDRLVMRDSPLADDAVFRRR